MAQLERSVIVLAADPWGALGLQTAAGARVRWRWLLIVGLWYCI